MSNKTDDNKPFAQWFGGSKVVDAEGKPLVVYHGTPADFTTFDLKRSTSGLFGTGFYFTDRIEMAKDYANGGTVMQVYLALRNPASQDVANRVVDEIGEDNTDEIRAELERLGHDGVLMSSYDEVLAVAFRPEQIKSAIGNNGEYDPANPDIRFSEADDVAQDESFLDWFDGSAVVDRGGSPLVVYHGTNETFTEFDPERFGGGALGAGFYFAEDRSVAESAGVNVMQVHLQVKNPLVLSSLPKSDLARWTEFFEREPHDAMTEVIEAGHDGILDDVFTDRNWVVFDPAQIKSATGNYDASNPDIRFSEADDDARAPAEAPAMFYSQLPAMVADAPGRLQTLSAQQWKAWLLANGPSHGVRHDELTWSGVLGYLDGLGKAKLSRADLLEYVAHNGVKIQEVILSGDAQYRDANGNRVFDQDTGDYVGAHLPAKYADRTLIGGENYREVLLMLPPSARVGRFDVLNRDLGLTLKKARTREEAREWLDTHQGLPAARRAEIVEKVQGQPAVPEYRTSHWDQPNVLVHLRVNDRVDADGSKVLFVEELQSDWGQDGKKTGFVEDVLPTGKIAIERDGDAFVVMNNGLPVWGGLSEQRAQEILAQQLAEGLQPVSKTGGAPPGPFVNKTEGWLNLGLKRIALMAVEGGYDRVAFINGEQSVERYSLSETIKCIDYLVHADGRYDVVPINQQNKAGIKESQISLERMQELFGRDVASQIAQAGGEPLNSQLWAVFEGQSKLFESRYESDVREYARVAAGNVEVRTVGDVGQAWRTLDGLNLVMGGDGMRAFYDEIVPAAMKTLVRRLGGESQRVKFPAPEAVRIYREDVISAAIDYLSGRLSSDEFLESSGLELLMTVEEVEVDPALNGVYEPGRRRHVVAEQFADRMIARAPVAQAVQHGFSVTDKMRQVVREGLPLFGQPAARRVAAPVDGQDDAPQEGRQRRRGEIG